MLSSGRSSSNSKKASALQALKERRLNGSTKTRTEEYEIASDDDLFDEVDEEEYTDIVQQRREREDFVVDDDGLGYHDDGEEVVFRSNNINHEAEEKKKVLAEKRRQTQLARQRAKRVLQTGDDDNNGSSMWDFVKTGGGSNHRKNKQPTSLVNTEELHDLLHQLDAPQPKKSRKRSKKTRRVYGKQPPSPKFTPPPASDDWNTLLPTTAHDNDDDDNDDDIPMTLEEPEQETSRKLTFESPTKTSSEAQVTPEEALPVEEQHSEESQQPSRRKRLAFPTQRLSAAAQKAKQLKEQQLKQKQQTPPMAKPPTAPTVVELPKSMTISVESTPTTAAAGPAKSAVALDTVLEEDGSLKLFYMDMEEVKGTVYLFGKLQSGVSACVVVPNLVRNIFLCPKDGSSMQDVHSDLRELMRQCHIPEYKAKPVKRKYAFGDSNIPRDETDYLKVVYNAKYPPLSTSSTTHIDSILGTTYAPSELFLLKRKLQGPSWISIHNVKPVSNPATWCKLECTVETYKDISTKIINMPPPSVASVTFKLQTDSKQHVVAVSAIYHPCMSLDGNKENDKRQEHICIVRPFNKGAFPRDFNSDKVIRAVNERALLNRLLVQIGLWDPDVLCAHQIWSLDMPTLLSRCQHFKVFNYSKLGRKRFPYKWNSGTMNDYHVRQVTVGRLLCDTYLSAQELLHESTYTLNHLAKTLFQMERKDVDPESLPHYFLDSNSILSVVQHSLQDAQLILSIMTRLQILPLTLQLTCLAGYLWGRTLKGQRAERNEYLLLHEFHKRKYLVPEKIRDKSLTKGKSKYSGGLVLEPKRGLYDSFILLLDFNSLYPSIIQEYNLCFTTMDWTRNDEVDPTCEVGILPKVISSLIERRKAVKKILKTETSLIKKQELDIRQQALKLTANSMYGCLGFSHSRFYAQTIAAKITSTGRDTLSRTVDIARDELGLDVIYGDTDSIMINTLIPGTNLQDLPKVMALGNKVKQKVNQLYQLLELEVDGYFQSMLLLKKKKYAALTIQMQRDGSVKIDKEIKGLDMVRRDWCALSKECGEFCLNQILSGKEREVVVQSIEEYLRQSSQDMRDEKLPLEKFIITKGLSKHPNDYPDAKSLPHVIVAKSMLQANKPVSTGDFIPYVICAAQEDEIKQTAAERARHPEEIQRSNGALKPDVEWYLSQQILPPISRLCDPVDGLSHASLASQLGIESTSHSYTRSVITDEKLVDYTPASSLPDNERFQFVEKLCVQCKSCGTQQEVRGVFDVDNDQNVSSALNCTNVACQQPEHFGYGDDLYVALANSYDKLYRTSVQQYYNRTFECNDPSCKLQTRQISVAGTRCCLARGCDGTMHPLYTEEQLYTQLKYLVSLFDISHVCPSTKLTVQQVQTHLSPKDVTLAQRLHQIGQSFLKQCAYNYVPPSIFQTLFPTTRK